MGKKFLEGALFGTGFALAFLVIGWLGLSILSSVTPDKLPVAASERSARIPKLSEQEGPRFHELPLEEQIKKASVIALARYESAPDGKSKAIIKEFLKKAPHTTIYYNIGDEYPEGSFYPSNEAGRGDGLIIFFVGSPAEMRMSVTYSGNRIRSLGDIPLELFRDKCASKGV